MTISDVGLLVLRLGIGLIFFAHGAQKAFGWWGGPGPKGWHSAIRGMGFAPAELFAWASMGAEVVGGMLLAFGLLTPLAASVLIARTVVIVFHAHWAKGFFNKGGGYEFPLALGVGSLALGLTGPGAVSVDQLLGIDWTAAVRVALVVVGLVMGAVSLMVPRLAAAPREREAPAGQPRTLRRNLRRT